jgi:three-Cys-motif partner protein
MTEKKTRRARKTQTNSIVEDIGPWSEIKLEIIKRYAEKYSKILTKQPGLHHAYIDAFSGPGVHRSRTTGEHVKGSPLNARLVNPPFEHYYFIDVDEDKTSFLQDIIGDEPDVSIYTRDCNIVLREDILPRFAYENFWKALCLLDPYGLDLDWEVIQTAGETRSVEVFINFPIHDINRNLVRTNPKEIKDAQLERMDRFWGDRSWYPLLYEKSNDLFGEELESRIAVANAVLPRTYLQRLKGVAGFSHVSGPLAMRNKTGAVVYYMYRLR